MSLRQAGPSIRPLCRRCLLLCRNPPSVPSSRSFSSTSLIQRQPQGRQRSFDTPTKSFRSKYDAAPRAPLQLAVSDFDRKPPPRPRELVKAMIRRIPEWIASPRARNKLETYGLSASEIGRFGKQWASEVENGLLGCESDEEAVGALRAGGWNGEDLLVAMAEGRLGTTLEAAALRQFLAFCVRSEKISSSSRSHLRALLQSTDLTRLAYSADYIPARAMTRHFHMHVGPTNSGKTYNALKALSKAKSGAYAGPLRLLAHEVWERLNLGTVGDLNGQGKACNLLTGEERRVVDQNAKLLSCTVEMLPLGGINGNGYDVVVVDEIQMLGDEQRGGAWTKAVLGCAAREIHLCGDETTVELVRSIVTSLGDQLTIHRYERLSPLTVAEESLENSFDKVEDGDCIVTFSRSNIFSVKKLVESTAGKKCAVVYGALPPETRAEQARDFNDENGICKVLVASDAVGMGLNLKIKRMIFESLSKFNGKTEVPLALTQIKQIAGRAGRYKTANDSNIAMPDEAPATGGLVTTLREADLPILRELMTRSLPSIRRASLEVPYASLSELATLLPSKTTFSQLLEHFASLAQVPPKTVLSAYEQKLPLADIVEDLRDSLSLSEIDLFCYAPVSSRDDRAKSIFRNLVEDFADRGKVLVDDIFEQSNLIHQLELVEETLRTLPPLPPVLGTGRKQLTPPIIVTAIPQLETLHKSLVLYIWLSFRLEIAFPDRDKAVDYKMRTESVLDQCLERLPGLKQKKQSRSVRQLESKYQSRDRRKEQVMPNATGKDGGVARKGLTWLPGNEAKRVREKKVWRNAAVLDTNAASEEARERA